MARSTSAVRQMVVPCVLGNAAAHALPPADATAAISDFTYITPVVAPLQ